MAALLRDKSILYFLSLLEAIKGKHLQMFKGEKTPGLFLSDFKITLHKHKFPSPPPMKVCAVFAQCLFIRFDSFAYDGGGNNEQAGNDLLTFWLLTSESAQVSL